VKTKASVAPTLTRTLLALALTLVHATAAYFGSRLPNALAAFLAGTVYGPLWLVSQMGLPVFGPAESGGWAGPSLLGWTFLALFWFAVWWLLVSLLLKWRARNG
jgi:hypothetical protein